MQKVSSPSLADNYRLYRRRSPSRKGSFLMQNIATINFIFLLLQCILRPNYANNIYEDDDTLRSTISRRQMNYQNSTDGSCHLSVSTQGIQETISGRGLVFSIKSDEDNVDGLWITSFGIHVDRNSVKESGLGYEVYALKEDGYYADPIRNPNNTGQLLDESSYDYRGSDLLAWDMIAEGTILVENLTQSITTLMIFEDDYYKIPFEDFTKTSVPGQGGVRSFYITTLDSGYVYSNPAEINNDGLTQGVNDEMKLLVDPGINGPIVLVGERASTYPMPDSALYYASKSFVGNVFYEMDCPTAAPSVSTSPSASPTFPLTDSPSLVPSTSTAPTGAPSVVASDAPSLMPSSAPSIYVLTVTDGLLLTIKMTCFPDEDVPQADIDAVAESIIAASVDGALEQGIYNVNATVVGAFCAAEARRNLLWGNLVAAFNPHHRRLATLSSALDFSVVITGDYRPPKRADGLPPEPADLNLGAIAEDSINADPEGFVKDLQERAGPTSDFATADADDLAVETFVVADGTDLSQISPATRSPTKQPTSAPTIVPQNTARNILVICIVITAGIILLLAAYLFFRHGERKAKEKRREKMERKELEKERRRMEKRQKAAMEGMSKHAYMDYDKKDNKHQFGTPVGYGYPTQALPPNYPQNYNYPDPSVDHQQNYPIYPDYPPQQQMQGYTRPQMQGPSGLHVMEGTSKENRNMQLVNMVESQERQPSVRWNENR